MLLFLYGVVATVTVLALAILAQDLAYYFLGLDSMTTDFVRRHTPRNRVRLTARIIPRKVDDHG